MKCLSLNQMAGVLSPSLRSYLPWGVWSPCFCPHSWRSPGNLPMATGTIVKFFRLVCLQTSWEHVWRSQVCRHKEVRGYCTIHLIHGILVYQLGVWLRVTICSRQQSFSEVLFHHKPKSAEVCWMNRIIPIHTGWQQRLFRFIDCVHTF